MTLRVAFRYGDRRVSSRMVAGWLRSDTPHCEVAGEWAGHSHHCVGSSFLDGGVRRKTIVMPPEKWRVYEVSGDPGALWGWYERNAGARYDTLGALGFVLRPLPQSRRRRFCSEVVAEVLGYADPWRFDPPTLESVVARTGARVQ
jgi:hypothetical protein